MTTTTTITTTTSRKSVDNDDDLYDFSGLTLDLRLLKSELLTLQHTNKDDDNDVGLRMRYFASAGDTVDEVNEEGEEEWLPPTPPVYDVADKLVVINQLFHEDPTSTMHQAGKVRWRPGDTLVQIKWMNDDDLETPSVTSRFLPGSASQRIIVLGDLPHNVDSPDDEFNARMTAYVENRHRVAEDEDVTSSTDDPSDSYSMDKSAQTFSLSNALRNNQMNVKPRTRTLLRRESDTMASTRNRTASATPPTSRRNNVIFERNRSSDYLLQKCPAPPMASTSGKEVHVKKRSPVMPKGLVPKTSYPSETDVEDDVLGLQSRCKAKVRLQVTTTASSRPLRRKASHNSLSSNSSVSSQGTEDSSHTLSSSDSFLQGAKLRSKPMVLHARVVVTNVSQGAVQDWRMRKREEKRLRERKAFIESQMRRFS